MSNRRDIDVHAHVVPEPLLEAVRGGALPGVTSDGPSIIYGQSRLGPIAPAMFSLSERIAWLDSEGIAAQWVSPWLDLFTWATFPDAERRPWVRAVNTALCDATKASAGRLRPVPFVDISSGGTDALDDTNRVLSQIEAPAVMVSSAPPGAPLASDSYADFWTEVARQGVTVMLHPPVNGPSCAFTSPVVQNVSGRVIDASAAVVELMIAGVFDRLPDLEVIVVHGGGFLPYQSFRLDGLVRAGLRDKTAMTSSPSDILRRLWFDTVALDPWSIELLVRRVGTDRVMLGSDAPFPIGDPHPSASVRMADLPSDIHDAICFGNATRLAARRRSSTDRSGN